MCVCVCWLFFVSLFFVFVFLEYKLLSCMWDFFTLLLKKKEASLEHELVCEGRLTG